MHYWILSDYATAYHRTAQTQTKCAQGHSDSVPYGCDATDANANATSVTLWLHFPHMAFPWPENPLSIYVEFARNAEPHKGAEWTRSSGARL